MKPILLLSGAVLLFCGGNAVAQKAIDTGQTRPMTRYEKAIAKIDNMNDLKIAYDTLKTMYDRRYFLHALPGYFADHEIKSVPAWIEQAVLDGIESRRPLYMCEAIRTAGALRIDYSRELMALYPEIQTTYGCHEELLKSSAIYSISRMDNMDRVQFYYSILSNERMAPLGAIFNALLEAIYATPDPVYAQKLAEYSSNIATRIDQIQAQPGSEEKHLLPGLMEVKSKVDRVAARIAITRQGGVK